MKKTVLIFGISSFVGSNLAEFLKDEFRVVGTYFEHKPEIEGVLTIPCDVLSRDEVQITFLTAKPDFTIYCCGLRSIKHCHEHAKLADALNTVGVFTVTEYCERYKSKMCLLSTAYVFSGEERDMVESDTPDPNTMYGKTKASAEFFIQKSCLNYLIFRCGHLYGRSYCYRDNTFFETLEQKLAKGESTRIDGNVTEGFIDIDYLAMIIKVCLKRDVTNRLFQVSSKNTMTRYDFGKAYALKFEAGDSLVNKGAWKFHNLDGFPGSSRGLFYKMDIFNVESYLGIEMPTVEESLDYTFHRLGGRDDKRKSKKQSVGIKFI